jgi:poly-gamma-glutamate synthesis protein (capsule biosynthesis protein)
LQEQPGNPPKIRTQVDLRDEERLCKDIRRARTIADHVIVGIHWGIAFSKERAEYQQPLGRKMIEAGARLVVGHHPHVRQGLERYQDGVILYSLGDFVFHDRADMTGESGMMTIVELGKKRLRSLRLIPIKVDLKAGLPSLGDAAARKELLEEMKQLSPKEDLSEDGVGVRLTL